MPLPVGDLSPAPSLPQALLPFTLGTSGYRKPTALFLAHPILPLFSLAALDTLNLAPNSSRKGLLLGGDGRFLAVTAVEQVVHAVVANAATTGIDTVFVPTAGLISTPAAAGFIAFVNALAPEASASEEVEELSLIGGILATASHNPGGPLADFGLKVNVGPSGAPAPVAVTTALGERVAQLCEDPTYREHFSLLTSEVAGEEGTLLRSIFPPNMLAAVTPPCKPYRFTNRATRNLVSVHVFDAPAFYVKMLEPIFDFGAITRLFQRPDFRFAVDGMHGVAGPFARRLFVDTLGAPEACLRRCNPLSDFGGLHPDPNLTYAADLWESAKRGEFDLGAACDGDADRNMIVGYDTFVNPCDSLAVLADFAATHMPFYAARLRALARSMPTSRAIDHVAAAHSLKMFEVPTGWKYFANIMDFYDKLSGRQGTVMCGEESFGTGSSHVREKDGLWAVCMWLQLLAHYNADASKPLVTVSDVLIAHWQKYGRNYFTRYDYEQVEVADATKVMAGLGEWIAAPPSHLGEHAVVLADNFAYTDPFDESVATGQGIRIELESGARMIFRLSGTGSQGATIRMYVESYVPAEAPLTELLQEPAQALQEMVDLALELSQIAQLTGRTEPSVIT